MQHSATSLHTTQDKPKTSTEKPVFAHIKPSASVFHGQDYIVSTWYIRRGGRPWQFNVTSVHVAKALSWLKLASWLWWLAILAESRMTCPRYHSKFIGSNMAQLILYAAWREREREREREEGSWLYYALVGHANGKCCPTVFSISGTPIPTDRNGNISTSCRLNFFPTLMDSLCTLETWESKTVQN